MFCPDMPLEPPALTKEQDAINEMLYTYRENQKMLSSLTRQTDAIKERLEDMGYCP